MATTNATPLVSVVIPMYNAEKFIDKCITHLVHQTYKNLEIIIVDDGSTDDCVNVCKQWAKQDKRIKIISQENAGPAAASNTGMDAAKGAWIHFHDHDDFVNLDYFEKMINAAILTNADILCGEVNQPDYNFPVFDKIEICTHIADKILTTRANKFKPAWRYVYKKEFLDRTGLRFEPAIFGAQDLIFTRPAIVLADSVATVPGARYNVVNTITALGKQRKKLKKEATKPETEAAWRRYWQFLIDHDVVDLLSAPEEPYKTETFKMFNRPIFRKEILTKRIRYYLFGINIGTKHINP